MAEAVSGNYSRQSSLFATHETMVLAADQSGWPQGTTLNDVMSEYARYQTMVGHKYFVRCHVHGEDSNTLKSAMSREFGLTHRQFSSISHIVDGKAAAVREGMKLRLCEIERRALATSAKVKLLDKNLAGEIKKDGAHRAWRKRCKTAQKAGRKAPKLPKALAGFHPGESREYRKKLRFELHQKKRRVQSLAIGLGKLQEAVENDCLSICFGSKKLFGAQNHLTENAYANHAEWKAEWNASRANQVFCIGSKDEIFGSQTASWMDDGKLRIRLPAHMESRFGKYVVLFLKPFRREGLQVQVCAIARAGGRRDKDRKLVLEAQPLSWRLVRRDTKHGVTWVAQVGYDQPDAKRVTDIRLGAWGVDFNPDHVAMTLVNRFGNPVDRRTYSIDLVDKTHDQNSAILGDAAAWVVDQCVAEGVPLCAEVLDFRVKKAALHEKSSAYARMLSQFAYSTFQTLTDRRAASRGVEMRRRNPAYTSVIGEAKFALGYAMSVHNAAGCAIARCGMGFSERLSRRVSSPSNEAVECLTPSRNAFPLPARTRGKHVWSDWNRHSRKLRDACRKARTVVDEAGGSAHENAGPILAQPMPVTPGVERRL